MALNFRRILSNVAASGIDSLSRISANAAIPTCLCYLCASPNGVFDTSQPWSTFWNALYGVGGKISELFPTQSERVAFTKTAEYGQIMQMLEQLQKSSDNVPPADASGKVFVRAPKSLHAALIAEAEAEGVSLNQLCVTKLSMQLRATV